MKKKEKIPYKIPTVTKAQQKKRLIGDILLILLPCLVLLLFMRVFFIIGAVPSTSMFPLMDKDYNMIANRMAYKFGEEPARGDVIVFKKGNSHMTKRIIGIPGDSIAIQNGIVYINKQPIVESYLAEENSTEPLNGVNYYEVPENSYFVMGDNRKNSNDSRAWKEPFIPIDNIKAKVICVFCLNPFTNGIVYTDVENISIMETNSGVPAYDKDNIFVETTGETMKDNDKSNVDNHISSTLPVVTIAPETIQESIEETEVSEESSLDEAENIGTESEKETESAAESHEGMVAEENIE